MTRDHAEAERMSEQKTKTFDNLTSRKRLTTTHDELVRLRRRLDRLDARLVEEVDQRVRDVDSAVIHLRDVVGQLRHVRSMRGPA
jgi:hypothetical protein